jgi:hypothetical protein
LKEVHFCAMHKTNLSGNNFWNYGNCICVELFR